jgi:hypothetical protein
VELTYDYLDEYNALSDGEKQQYVDEFEENREVAKKVKRPTSRSRFQDVLNIMRIIIKLVCLSSSMCLETDKPLQLNGLQLRVGIEAMVCIVRNTTNVYFAPQWYFTAPELAAYMPIATKHMWETSVVGAKMEAFAIAGCDPASKSVSRSRVLF